MKGDIYLFDKIDRFIEPNTYFYSEFFGEELILAWTESRMSIINKGFKHSAIGEESSAYISDLFFPTDTSTLLTYLTQNQLRGDADFKPNLLELLIKRFEVTKKIYTAYDQNLRPINKENFREVSLYVDFAALLCVACDRRLDLVYLNSLLKVMDILASITDRLDPATLAKVRWLAEKELQFVEVIRKKTAL